MEDEIGKKRGPKDKETRDKRREEVFNYMKSLGPYSIPSSVLADKHNCTVKMVYNDRDYWLKRIKFEDISLEGKKILMGLMKNMSITEELKAKGDPNQRLKAIMTSNNTAEVFTKILEQYGFKEKIADKVFIESSESVRKKQERYKKEFEKIKDLPKEQQELIKKIMVGEDGTSV